MSDTIRREESRRKTGEKKRKGKQSKNDKCDTKKKLFDMPQERQGLQLMMMIIMMLLQLWILIHFSFAAWVFFLQLLFFGTCVNR